MTYKTRLLRIGYLLGISLLLASIVYFFAANWAGLDRLSKVFLSAGLTALFYGCSFIPLRLPKFTAQRDFLARMLLLGGLIAFGVSVALIGQIYNSHADSYGLFLIWCIPALLLSVVSRHEWFYLTAYALVHLTVWLYFFPTSMNIDHGDIKQALIYGLFAAGNLLIFALCEYRLLKSVLLRYVSFIVFHIAVLWLSNSFILGKVGYWLNLVSVVVIIASFYWFSKVRIDKWALSITALAASSFTVLKFMELAEEFYSELFFIYGLLFVAALLTGNVLFFRYLARLNDPEAEAVDVNGASEGRSTDGASEDGSSEADADPRISGASPHTTKTSGQLAARIVAMIVTAVGVAIGTVSLIGLVFLAFSGEDPEDILYVMSLLFVIPMLLIPKLNDVVRYTVLTIGYISGIVSILWIGEPALSTLYFILAAAGWLRLEGLFQRLLTYLIFNFVIAVVLEQINGDWLDSPEQWTYILLSLAAVNSAVYGLSMLLRSESMQSQNMQSQSMQSQNMRIQSMRSHLQLGSLLFGLASLFSLSFMDDIFDYSHLLFNLIYFLLASGLVVVFVRRERTVDSAISLAFWFAYIVFQYYDMIWPLLHKSLSLLILGCIVLAGTAFAERWLRGHNLASDKHGLPNSRWLVILLIIALQFVWIGYQTMSNEQLLENGRSIKLELQPVDPRSLLQGDYVQLSYKISNPPYAINKQLEKSGSQSRVRVVLREDDSGIYVFDRLYQKGEALNDDEVMLTGRTNGWSAIYYGIESYFVPEGTGMDVQQTVKFAYVRVGTSGNAMLEKLSED